MRRLLGLALVVAGTWCGAVSAEETPEQQLDFVRKLRAKGYHDLSKEYIEGLRKSHPQLAGQLSLEEARSLVAMAREKPPGDRDGLFGSAQQKFEEFVKKHDGKPEAVQARLELAKLIAYRGQASLAKALRDFEELKDQHEAARKAEALFAAAGAELEIVIKQLPENEQAQAKFDRAVNYMDQARTYIDVEAKDEYRRKRAELVEQAQKIFQSMATDTSSEEGALANAWLVKVFNDGQNPGEATKHLKKVLGSEAKAAIPGQRLARYFQIQYILKDVNLKVKPIERLKMIKDEGNKWLKDYGPASIRTWEGQGVRLELANAYLAEAQLIDEKLQAAAVAAPLKQAQSLYDSIADLDGDFSEEAKRSGIFLAVRKLEKVKRDEIRDFDNSVLKAHYEMHQFKKTPETVAKLRGDIDNLEKKKADAEAKKAAAEVMKIDAEIKKIDAEIKKLEATRKTHVREAVLCLVQALNLADLSVPLQKVDEARYLLMSLLYSTGDLYRAAVAGEALGRTRPPTKRAPIGVGLAFRAYEEIATALRDDTDANRQRVRELAEYVLSPEMQKFWATESVTGVAHHRLAMLHHKDKEFKQALVHLEKLTPDFGGYVYSQGQIVFIALDAAGDQNNKLTDADRKALKSQARVAIGRMPESLPADADPTTAVMYFLAKMEEAKFLYKDAADELKASKLADAAKKYQAMAQFISQHNATFTKSPIKFEEKRKDNIEALIATLTKYSRLGLADVEYRLGNYDKVLSKEGIGAEVQQLKDLAGKQKEGKLKITDFAVSGEVLGLALRSHVQKGDVDNAKLLFDILQRIGGDDGFDTDNTNMMFQLIADIEQQVKQQKGDPAKLKTLVENFSKFIDVIADPILKQRASPREYMFLANAYATLGEPTKAADLYAKVPSPKQISDVDEELRRRADAKKPGFDDAEITKLRTRLVEEALRTHPEQAKLEEGLKKLEASPKTEQRDQEIEEVKTKLAQLKSKVAGDILKERQEYWYLQIQHGKSLREGKDFKKAYNTLDRIVNHPLGEYHILAEMEKLFVLEDSAVLGAAIKGWNALMTRLRERVSDDTSIKKLYFECYFYNARCWYKYSQSKKVQDAGKEEQALTSAARYIVSLEYAKSQDGWNMVGDRFIELMDAEPKLKAMYEKLKKAQTAPAGK